MPRSELAHADRDGMDLARGLREIGLTRVVVAGRAQESDRKTGDSRRAISLDTLTAEALKSHVAMLDDEREAFGDAYPAPGLLRTDIVDTGISCHYGAIYARSKPPGRS